MRSHPISTVVSWALALVATFCLPLLYLRTYGGPVHAVGWDSYGYMWQSRAVGLVPLADIGTRLGVPMIGSLFQHIVGVPFRVEPVVVGLTMMVGLALAAAAVLRLAFKLPGWTVAVMALVIGWWGGTSRLAAGYQANVLSLLLFTAAVAVYLRSRGRTSLLVCGFGLLIACGITHPGFMPVYVSIVIGWAVLSFFQLRRDREEGRSLWRTEPIAAAAGSLVAAALVAFVDFGLLHHTLRDVADFSVISRLFGIRLSKLPAQVGAASVIVLAPIGIWAAWRLRRGREDRMLSTLGAAWLAACIGGLVLGLIVAAFPAHRAVLFATPVAAAMALGVVYVGEWVAGFRGRGGALRVLAMLGAAVVMAAAVTWVAATGRSTYSRLAATPRAYVDDGAQRISDYLALVQPSRPVVIATNRIGLVGILTAKLHLNAARAYAPTDQITNIYVYLGPPSNALASRPTYFDNATDWEVEFNKASKQAWPSIEPILKQNPIILFNQEQVSGQTWGDALATDPQKIVTPGLYVARGPLVTLDTTSTPPVSAARVTVMVFVCVLLLGVLGGGFGWASTVVGGGGSLDAAALAPGFGAGVIVLAGFGVAALGVVPGSPAGLGAMATLGGAGYALAFALHRGGRYLLQGSAARTTSVEPEPAGEPASSPSPS